MAGRPVKKAQSKSQKPVQPARVLRLTFYVKPNGAMGSRTEFVGV